MAAIEFRVYEPSSCSVSTVALSRISTHACIDGRMKQFPAIRFKFARTWIEPLVVRCLKLQLYFCCVRIR